MLKLFGKLKNMIFNYSSEYDNCYCEMEDEGTATMGSCSGFYNNDKLNQMCFNCPYFVNIEE